MVLHDLSPVYGWGAASFSKPESQTPQDVSLAYFKGPAGVQLILDIIDTRNGTGIYVDNVFPIDLFLSPHL